MPNQTDRPKVGPADPETRRKLLNEKLNEPTKSTGVAPKAEKPKPKKKRSAFGEVADALDPKVSRERRVGEKGETMQDAIDKGIEEAKEAKGE